MGLTVNYSIKCRSCSADAKAAAQLIDQMRQLALDLPFDAVGDVTTLCGKACDVERYRGAGITPPAMLFYGRYIRCPWNKNYSKRVGPKSIIGFSVDVGFGSESAEFGLAEYPETIDWEYKPEDDARFIKTVVKKFSGGHSTSREFSYKKWRKWWENGGRIGPNDFASPWDEELVEMRQVPTKLRGWSWGGFCKTQYASSPEAGGVPNFLRCHISLITLLERIGKLPGIRVDIDDEGKYGPSHYSDDWKEAYAAGRKPTYVPHLGKYSPAELVREVGEWNELVAAMFGSLRDALPANGGELVGPITEFKNFEQLELRGQEAIKPFLSTMRALADKERAKQTAEVVP